MRSFQQKTYRMSFEFPHSINDETLFCRAETEYNDEDLSSRVDNVADRKALAIGSSKLVATRNAKTDCFIF